MEWNEPYAKGLPVTIVADGMNTVTSPTRYSPNSGDLTVFYNGVYAIKGQDYIEVSPYSIQFKFDVEKGDVVVFHVQKLW